MTIKIELVEPGRTRLTLECDGDHWPEVISASFEHDEGYVAQRSLAMRAGWKETSDAGERVFFGPCCSGKVIEGGIHGD